MLDLFSATDRTGDLGLTVVFEAISQPHVCHN